MKIKFRCYISRLDTEYHGTKVREMLASVSRQLKGYGNHFYFLRLAYAKTQCRANRIIFTMPILELVRREATLGLQPQF